MKVAVILFRLFLLVLSPWQDPKPMPHKDSFLAEFRKTLHSDDKLQRQYTYTQKETETTLDGKGHAKKAEVNVYQVIQGAEDWQSYQRQTVKNGVPVSQQELEKRDREEKERVERETKKRAGESEAKRREKKAKQDRDEQEALDDIFAMYEVQLIRREILNDIPTIVVTFKAKPDYRPKTSPGKILQHIAGKAWIAEDDHELAKVEAEIIDPISIVGGFLAKVQKGSTVVMERRKVNNEAWLPFRAEASINGKLLLLKGINIRELIEYSDYRKYTVDTILQFSEPPKEH
jgi:hypothetical protein